MAETEKSLYEALAGECQANRKYEMFAEKATRDGFANIGKLFRAASAAEAIHAKRILNILLKSNTTEQNLESAIAGETYEFTEMYPQMEQRAEAEGRRDARTVFNQNSRAERIHANLYNQALEALRRGVDFEGQKIYLCPFCGHLEVGNPPERCPICGLKGENFQCVE
eukprot:gnl/Trimastix_PCT/354.p1 GENE.gnl/Trimastix_PCT/354~~gnl/Trimastix_PCT/354.p1  ORF type:complete len:184 (-),score=65.03 gnl/Trimastix_PCT/354:49-552(-)